MGLGMKEERKAGTEVEEIISDEVGQESPLTLKEFLEEAVSLLLTAYLFIIFCIYPFYIKNGYSDIGNEKYQFYKYITMGGLGLILPLALLISTLLPFPSPSLNLITPVGSTSTLMALSAVVVSWKPFLV